MLRSVTSYLVEDNNGWRRMNDMGKQYEKAEIERTQFSQCGKVDFKLFQNYLKKKRNETFSECQRVSTHSMLLFWEIRTLLLLLMRKNRRRIGEWVVADHLLDGRPIQLDDSFLLGISRTIDFGRFLLIPKRIGSKVVDRRNPF